MLTRRTALAALLALLPLASAAPAFIPPCAVTGAVQWGNWRVPLCKQFHTASTASAIRVPNDTSTTIYGTIWGPAPSWKYEFRTRTGALFKVDSGPVAPLEQAGLSGQMTTGIFKATLNSNRAIVRVEPAVFVEIGAFVHPFKGSYLSGELINSVPGR